MSKDVTERAHARKALSQRVRFDVFKRDKFTCQYCGDSAPNVLLQCDHIHPVAEGGTNDILNLVTSCKPCNGGKGSIPLASSAALDKQSAMLADLEDRRQQIEMMLRWRDELQSHKEDVVEQICERFERACYEPNDAHKGMIRKWLKRFSVDEIIAAGDECFDLYLEWCGSTIVPESWTIAFNKIPNIVLMQRQEEEKPQIRRLLYINGIIRNRTKLKGGCVDYLEYLHECGADLDQMESRAKRADSFSDFCDLYAPWLASMGKTAA